MVFFGGLKIEGGRATFECTKSRGTKFECTKLMEEAKFEHTK